VLFVFPAAVWRVRGAVEGSLLLLRSLRTMPPSPAVNMNRRATRAENCAKAVRCNLSRWWWRSKRVLEWGRESSRSQRFGRLADGRARRFTVV